MLPDLATSELIDFRYESVQELTVMADDDGGTVESLDGFLQHILGRHVQMVGGLIENQEIDGFQQQTDHCQSTAFPAAKNLHLLIRSLSTKHKGSKYIIDAQADITLRHIVDGLEDRQRLVEQLCLVLGEITNLDIMSDFQVTIKRNLSHDTLHKGRLTFTVLSHECDFLTSLDRQVDVREYRMVAVRFPDILTNDGIVTTAQTRRELQMHGGIVHLVHLDRYDFLQLLDLLLYLYRLGRLIAETLDELTHISHLLLLVLIGSLLLLTSLFAKYDILVILHLIVYDVPTGYLQRAVRDVIDECTVVTDQYDSLGTLRQELLQPLYGLDIQVVGGLVQQQHVGFL